MARISRSQVIINIIAIIVIMWLLFSVSADEEEDGHGFVRSGGMDRKLLLLGLKREKLSHFRFYWHDIFSGANASAVNIIKSASKTGFGTVNMIDDPLTEKPDLSSKLLGRAQGFYGVTSSQGEFALLMAMNFVFVQGKYNGSTITILGRNPVFNKVREMPVIGGSGLFRFARGYAHASTYKFDPSSGDAIVEYNVYLLHY